MRTIMRHLGVVVAALALAAPAWAGITPEELRKEPGYFDFGDLEKYFGGEPTVQVRLTQPLLSLADWAVREDDPDLAGLVAGLKLVDVNVFNCTEQQAQELRGRSDTWSKQLLNKDWEQVVKVKDRAERASVFVKMEEPGAKQNPGESPMLSGLTIVAVGEDDQAVFVNIVGRFEFDKISKLSHHFNIPEMQGMIDKEAQQQDRDRERGRQKGDSTREKKGGGTL
jgi:hypothetical protein